MKTARNLLFAVLLLLTSLAAATSVGAAEFTAEVCRFDENSDIVVMFPYEAEELGYLISTEDGGIPTNGAWWCRDGAPDNGNGETRTVHVIINLTTGECEQATGTTEWLIENDWLWFDGSLPPAFHWGPCPADNGGDEPGNGENGDPLPPGWEFVPDGFTPITACVNGETLQGGLYELNEQAYIPYQMWGFSGYAIMWPEAPAGTTPGPCPTDNGGGEPGNGDGGESDVGLSLPLCVHEPDGSHTQINTVDEAANHGNLVVDGWFHWSVRAPDGTTISPGECPADNGGGEPGNGDSNGDGDPNGDGQNGGGSNGDDQNGGSNGDDQNGGTSGDNGQNGGTNGNGGADGSGDSGGDSNGDGNNGGDPNGDGQNGGTSGDNGQNGDTNGNGGADGSGDSGNANGNGAGTSDTGNGSSTSASTVSQLPSTGSGTGIGATAVGTALLAMAAVVVTGSWRHWLHGQRNI